MRFRILPGTAETPVMWDGK